MHRESPGDSSCVGHVPGVGGVCASEAERHKKKKRKGGDGEKIHYVKDNLAGKYQNVSSTPDRGRGGKLSGGFCQQLKQAWIGAERRGMGDVGCGLHFELNLSF